MAPARPGLLGYPSDNPTILAQQRKQLAAYVIQDVLEAAGRPIQINAGSVRMSVRWIHFDTEVRVSLSDAIYGRMFPRTMSGEFYHYTGVEAFKSIANEGSLRLYWLRKRMGQPIEGELVNLARLEGWHILEADIEAAYDDPKIQDSPGSNLFYASLTKVDGGGDLWSFGPVRLHLRVDTTGKMGQLREIQYHAPGGATLLGEINDALATKGLPPILPLSSYRMAANSVPAGFAGEAETRLLHLHFEGQPDERQRDSDNGFYWPIPINGCCAVADVTLLGVSVNSVANLARACKAIENSPLSSIEPICVPPTVNH
ncbi:MAG: hypothetical protein HXX10_28715 [Rhodoplanes sp.]|uniref:hypothetical protein n=1 Tax=Rhodoplanes sp. TaxID=1968906 RepID=UPI00179BF1B5|nr:hypothetical protein [Rhodoplanes sp.]NVO18022.1 hypothetical protein [Rhodoplanes sp.]